MPQQADGVSREQLHDQVVKGGELVGVTQEKLLRAAREVAKEELAGTLVNIHHKIRKVDELLADLTAQEIEGLGDESMIFRGNSFATKAVECYLKIAGEKVRPQCSRRRRP